MGVQERREREKQARQDAILEAAQEIFFAKGLDQATIDEVAEKAELSKGTIYLYFKSKEELYISVLLKGLSILIKQFQGLRSRFADKAADELIREMRDIYYHFFKKYPEYFYIHSLLYHGRIKGKIDPDIWAATHQRMKAALQIVAENIESGVQNGTFRRIDCWKTANSFWGSATGVMMMTDDPDHQKIVGVSVKEQLDYTIELLIDSLSNTKT
jgi:AcrR family transcriptional regulator